MKFTTSILLTLQSAALTLAAPASVSSGIAASDNGAGAGDGTSTPASWRLDCGSPGTTAMCSASNSGAHCDPVSGDLTIILAGTCSACKCVSVDQCSRGCGNEETE
ncbi:hypothetical protein F5Y06DRAFT_293882 [Hypoxylon sp. FL0890]|nr:hypothetical protein F5Y06DRAFT_293882 [Hypoxylon sp. FL0890]